MDHRGIPPRGSSWSGAPPPADGLRVRAKHMALPPDEVALAISMTPRRPSRNDWTARTTATTCCGCCSSAANPDLPPRSKSRWRCASSRIVVAQIARAFGGEAAMEQRITARQSAHRKADVPFEAPGAAERAERVAASRR